MQAVLCFAKKHVVILSGVTALLFMFMIQWRVQYVHFDWSSVLVYLWASLTLYFSAMIIDYCGVIRNKDLSRLINNLLLYFSIVILIILLCHSSAVDLPLAPYPLIDTYLAQFDAFFHFNVADITDYTRVNWPLVSDFFQYVYASLEISVTLTLILLPIINQKSYQRLAFMFFFLIILTYIFCYFFPAVGPAYVYPESKFNYDMIALKNAYLKLRSDPTSDSVSSCIACPSWHVLSSLLILSSWWPVKKFGVRYIAVIYAVVLIISVFVTGAHYLADVFGSFIFMGVALYLAKKLDMVVPNYDFSMLKPLWNLVKEYKASKLANKVYN
ncbi:phosphatase PAP2 family protein [Thiotrichales bacterium 19X7-9]|nr:phosphatase PAP2 family protein [Thiotrichales bacterium 19X7-9]